MKRLIFILLICFTHIVTFAQSELVVKQFSHSPMDATASTQSRKDGHDRPGALIKVNIPLQGVTFECGTMVSNIIGDVTYHTNEYWVYMVAGQQGATHLKIKHPDYNDLDVKFIEYEIPFLESKNTYKLVINRKDNNISFSKYNQFYADVFFQAGQNMGVGISLGAHFHAINAELEFAKGISKSEKIYWYDKNELIGSSTYSSWSANFKLGYGFQFKRRFNLTPQLGFGLLKCTSDKTNPAKDANTAYALIGGRASFIFAKHMQVTLAPYYNFPLKKSASFEEISALQPTIQHWANGFNVKIGLTVFF